MTAQLLTGKEVAKELLEKLKEQVAKLNPRLVVVQVGEDPASTSYISQKMKSCELVGMRSEHIHLSEKTTKEELFNLVDELNNDPDTTGFIVQLPLPKHLESCVPDLIAAIRPEKDIDGFGPTNLGNTYLSVEGERLPPATPAGILEMLKFYKIDVQGKHVVVIGRSNIVGKPISVMLLNRGATVTVCHSKTSDLKPQTLQADVLVVAVGKAKLVTADMVKPGAVVIDVGVNRVDNKLCGDTDFDAVKEVASAITPVPGGVGPLTVACLIRNCVRAKELQD